MGHGCIWIKVYAPRENVLRGFLERKVLSYYLCIDRGTQKALAFKTSNFKLWELKWGMCGVRFSAISWPI